MQPHVLMFIYAVEIEGVRSCMACIIEQIIIIIIIIIISKDTPNLGVQEVEVMV